MERPVKVKVLDNYIINIEFSDGIEGNIDLSYLLDKGVFSSWSDYSLFKTLHLGDHGELLWDNDIDLCPDSIYLKLTKKKPEDIFSSLKEIINA